MATLLTFPNVPAKGHPLSPLSTMLTMHPWWAVLNNPTETTFVGCDSEDEAQSVLVENKATAWGAGAVFETAHVDPAVLGSARRKSA